MAYYFFIFSFVAHIVLSFLPFIKIKENKLKTTSFDLATKFPPYSLLYRASVLLDASALTLFCYEYLNVLKTPVSFIHLILAGLSALLSLGFVFFSLLGLEQYEDYLPTKVFKSLGFAKTASFSLTSMAVSIITLSFFYQTDYNGVFIACLFIFSVIGLYAFPFVLLSNHKIFRKSLLGYTFLLELICYICSAIPILILSIYQLI